MEDQGSGKRHEAADIQVAGHLTGHPCILRSVAALEGHPLVLSKIGSIPIVNYLFIYRATIIF